MRGWHVQQLRRIAIAEHVAHEGLLYCDSDMLFIKSFSTASLWRDRDLRLYRNSNGIDKDLPDGGRRHHDWTSHAATLLGLPAPDFPAHDYINNLVSWRRDRVLEMQQKIEAVSGKHWLAAVASRRSFSECQIYGAFVDGVSSAAGHWHGEGALCQTYWSGSAMTREKISNFVATMSSEQVAIGIQSFTGTDPVFLRELILS